MQVYVVKLRWQIDCELMVQADCQVFATREQAEKFAKKELDWFAKYTIEDARILTDDATHDYEVENDNNEWLEIDIEEKYLQ